MKRTFISLLRAINVSGQNPIRMPELKTLYEKLGYQNVTTYLQSGNVVFDALEQDDRQIARSLEAAIASTFGMNVPVLIRSTPDLENILASNPFASRANLDPARLVVVFLSAAPDELALSRLQPPPDIPDEFVLSEREIYLHCPNGLGRSKLTNSFFERKLGLVATSRNWNTVPALHAMAAQREKGD